MVYWWLRLVVHPGILGRSSKKIPGILNHQHLPPTKHCLRTERGTLFQGPKQLRNVVKNLYEASTPSLLGSYTHFAKGFKIERCFFNSTCKLHLFGVPFPRRHLMTIGISTWRATGGVFPCQLVELHLELTVRTIPTSYISKCMCVICNGCLYIQYLQNI